MAEPFKNLMNENVIQKMAFHFKKNCPEFDVDGFVMSATDNLETLELKQRTQQVTDTLIEYLPADFEKAGQVILASLGTPLGDKLSDCSVDANGIAGWAIMPLADFVGRQGLQHFNFSMELFREMTKRASAEFGIRFFLLQAPEKTLSIMKTWIKDNNPHVRRLVSEGIRPRLPWATSLPVFIKEPFAVIKLLELLKDDDSEYVRRSVANNLNDISKDHPELVADIAARWIKGASKQRQKIIRHACRTLIKAGHKKTLKVLGYDVPKLQVASVEILSPEVMFGDALQFSLTIASEHEYDQPLMIDYIVHHQKANGTTTPKVFKWKTLNLPTKEVQKLTKKHAIKKITTRIYYPGTHRLEVIINGVSVGVVDFQLLMPSPAS